MSSQLNNHRLPARWEDYFECQKCEKVFLNFNLFVRHISNKVCKKCKFCGNYYANKKLWKRHMNRCQPKHFDFRRLADTIHLPVRPTASTSSKKK